MTRAQRSAAAQLADLRTRLDAVDAAVGELVASLGDDERLRRPAPDQWGVADCFEHLITTGSAYYPIVRAVLGADATGVRDAHRSAPYRPTWFGAWFVRSASEGGPAHPYAADVHAASGAPRCSGALPGATVGVARAAR